MKLNHLSETVATMSDAELARAFLRTMGILRSMHMEEREGSPVRAVVDVLAKEIQESIITDRRVDAKRIL